MGRVTCYKCGSDTKLSTKARFRDGRVRLKICVDCRRKEYYARKSVEKVNPSFDDDWNLRAEASHQRIIKKYGIVSL